MTCFVGVERAARREQLLRLRLADRGVAESLEVRVDEAEAAVDVPPMRDLDRDPTALDREREHAADQRGEQVV